VTAVTRTAITPGCQTAPCPGCGRPTVIGRRGDEPTSCTRCRAEALVKASPRIAEWNRAVFAASKAQSP
jgi:hypothetical protein